MAALAVLALVVVLWGTATALWLADVPSISSRVDLVLDGDRHVDLADDLLIAA